MHNRVEFPDEVSVEISRASQQVFKTEARKNLFSYDRCFNGDASQEEVFEEVSEFVQSAIDGKRACVFCYGITGSGKTFTMGTGAGDCAELNQASGIVPRTVALIMDTLAADQTAQVEVSCLEVYNESINDLFVVRRPLPLPLCRALTGIHLGSVCSCHES